MDRITAAELARHLGASRSTVSSLMVRGLSALKDENGLLDRQEALHWIVSSTSGHSGGWDAGTRKAESLHSRAKALLARTEPKKGKTPASQTEPKFRPPMVASGYRKAVVASPDYGALPRELKGAVDMANALCGRARVAAVRELAGDSSELSSHAEAISQMFTFLISHWVGDFISAQLGRPAAVLWDHGKGCLVSCPDDADPEVSE